MDNKAHSNRKKNYVAPLTEQRNAPAQETMLAWETSAAPSPLQCRDPSIRTLEVQILHVSTTLAMQLERSALIYMLERSHELGIELKALRLKRTGLEKSLNAACCRLNQSKNVKDLKEVDKLIAVAETELGKYIGHLKAWTPTSIVEFGLPEELNEPAQQVLKKIMDKKPTWRGRHRRKNSAPSVQTIEEVDEKIDE